MVFGTSSSSGSNYDFWSFMLYMYVGSITCCCGFINLQVTESVDVCVENETVNYLNRSDVQQALHARLVGVNRWTVCSSILDYELLDVEIPTITIVGKLVKAGIHVLVYSGDQDSIARAVQGILGNQNPA